MKNKSKTQNSTEAALMRAKRRKIALIVFACAVLLPLLSAAVSAAIFAAWANTQSVDRSLLPTATAMPVYYDIDGAELPSAKSDYIVPSEVSDSLRYAFVALEDKRFYRHRGYDAVRIGGALLKNIKAGKIKEGASTITQQLVKNTHLTQERTLKRKLKELAIAIQLEKEYDKDEILSMYLSVIYFGNGAYGAKQAASVYFGKDIEELTLSECAALAGIVRNPSKYSPISNPNECRSRRDLVLFAMREQGYIKDEEYRAASSELITVSRSNDMSEDGAISAKACGFYLSQVQNEVCAALGITKYQLGNSGLKIYTNLDASLQTELERQRLNSSNYESDNVSSVSIVIDNLSGAVLAYSSSYPYVISRQAGSVLKPLAVYAPALDCGAVSLATPIADEKIDFGGYSPSNFGGVYYGDTTVREGIKKSMNSVSVKVLDYIGVDRSASCLHSFGIDIAEGDRTYALALGATANGVSPLKIAGGYSSLARGGEFIRPFFVKYVIDGGSKVYSNEMPSSRGVRAVSKSTASLMTSALADTVKDGTAKSLSALPFELAAKTGTVERSEASNSDAWCASYNEQFTVLVWHGSDSGMTERGGGFPTRHALGIWKDISNSKNISHSFAVPEDIAAVDVDTYSSKINKQVVAATENTPLEYRKTEYFPLTALPSPLGSKFENIPELSLDISANGSAVSIMFDTESIYEYEIYRTDVTGCTLIYSAIGSGARVSLFDRPISFGGKVEYTVICHLPNNDEIRSSSSKLIFVDSSNDYRYNHEYSSRLILP